VRGFVFRSEVPYQLRKRRVRVLLGLATRLESYAADAPRGLVVVEDISGSEADGENTPCKQILAVG
jgi:hypothetical protein